MRSIVQVHVALLSLLCPEWRCGLHFTSRTFTSGVLFHPGVSISISKTLLAEPHCAQIQAHRALALSPHWGHLFHWLCSTQAPWVGSAGSLRCVVVVLSLVLCPQWATVPCRLGLLFPYVFQSPRKVFSSVHLRQRVQWQKKGGPDEHLPYSTCMCFSIIHFSF